MIKFFQKIRQNLIATGATGKYLKYAIGEIVLVVIGILIALQINNWNEQKKANRAYENYKTLLIQELNEELANLKILDSISKNNKEVFENYFNNFNKNQEKDFDVLRENISSTLNLRIISEYKPINTIFYDLKNSGDIKLFGAEARNALININQSQESYMQNSIFDRDRINQNLNEYAKIVGAKKTPGFYKNMGVQLSGATYASGINSGNLTFTVILYLSENSLKYTDKVTGQIIDFLALLHNKNQ
ncbi:MAG: DUF6090 family protein [Saprospiraceae bacterium]